MDFQLATPIFHFATAHATPTRRSIGAVSVEIYTAPTGHASGRHASHESVNGTTYTTQSDCSGHAFPLHSEEVYGESPVSPRVFPDHSTAHRTDASNISLKGLMRSLYLSSLPTEDPDSSYSLPIISLVVNFWSA